VAALGAARPAPARGGLLDEVFSPAVLGALERIRLRSAHASGERPGHARVRGRDDASGLELERHVPYAPGDDLRRVDWNSYARLGELLTRRFVAEREVPVWLVIDRSGSMGPAGPGGKLDLACAVAAVLGIVSLSGGDRLSLAAIPGRRSSRVSSRSPAVESCGPLRSRRHLGALRSFLTSLEPAAGEGDLAAGIEEATRHVRRGVAVLISDVLIEPAAVAAALDVLRLRRFEGKLVQVLSREDLDPSWLRGRHQIEDAETGERYEIEPSVATWQRYRGALEDHLAEIRRAALERGVSSVLAVTDHGLERFLAAELPRLGLALVR